MSSLQDFLLIAEHDKEQARLIAETTAKEVEAKKTTLVQVVQSLGEYINDEDPILRGKAVSYLTAVIKALPPKFLSRQQVTVLTTFFSDRIEDGGAVTGLETLQKLERFSADTTQLSARAIFGNFQELQARPQSQRYQIYHLINELMTNHRTALCEMGDESLVGIVEVMTGEKDPRNLMLVFSILKVVMIEWDISNHVELLFDSVYNYFPITFRPPPNDPYKITAQDLKDRLQECVSSSSFFAPHAFPALLDKLDSTSINVKRDALNALSACIKSYDPNSVSRYSITIWDALKFEILNAQEEHLSELSLRVLSDIASRLSENVMEASQNLPLAHFLKPILKECNEQLREPQNKQAKPARRILQSLSNASHIAFTLTVQSVVAPLFTIYQEADSLAKQRGFLETFLALFESALELYGTWSSRIFTVAFPNPLAPFQEQFLEVLSQALMGASKEEVSYRITALKGLLLLSSLRQYFQDNEIGLFIQYLDEILLQEKLSGISDLKTSAIQALAEISKHKPRLIMDITLPAFLATLPDSDDGELSSILSTLEILAQISIEKDIFETLVRRLLNKLDLLLNAHTSRPDYPRAILLTVLYTMRKQSKEPNQRIESYYDNILVKFCRKVALASEEADSAVLQDSTILDAIGRIGNLIVRSASAEKKALVAKNLYNLFIDDGTFPAVPFSQSTTAPQRRSMILSTYLLAGLPKDISEIPHNASEILSLLQNLVNISVSETESATQLALLRHLALLVNKFMPTPTLTSASEVVDSLLLPHSQGEALNPGVIKAIFWLSKALILRLAPSTTQILTNLISLLSSLDIATSETSARGFAIILNPDDILSSENGANIRLLCRQRVFTTVIPLISNKIRELNTSTVTNYVSAQVKAAHLTALSGILSAIPPSLVMPELPTLLPLLLQSLDLEGSNSQPIKEATLQTLSVIIRDNGVAAIDESGHVSDLVRRLLRTASINPSSSPLSTAPVDDSSVTSTTKPPLGKAKTTPPSNNTNNPKLREQALRCLYLLAYIPSSASPSTTALDDIPPPSVLTSSRPREAGSKPSPLLPVKSQVLRSLRLILDDPRRDVRKAAVDARGVWLRCVGEENEDEED